MTSNTSPTPSTARVSDADVDRALDAWFGPRQETVWRQDTAPDRTTWIAPLYRKDMRTALESVWPTAQLADLQGRLDKAEAERDSLKERADVEVCCAQAVEFAEYVVEAAKGKMVERAQAFLSLPYSQELSARLKSIPSLQEKVVQLEQSNQHALASYAILQNANAALDAKLADLGKNADYVLDIVRFNANRLSDLVWDIEQLENWKTDMRLLGIHEVASQAYTSLNAFEEKGDTA